MPPLTLTDLVWIDATGYNYADYPTFLLWRQQQYQGIYGADVYLGADSQDGQLLAIQARADYDTAVLGNSVYNSFPPLTAQGAGLSRIVKINGLTRLVPSYSTVTLAIGGTAGTVITNGIAADVINQQWILPTTVTIPAGGTINVTATAAVIGAVFADSDTITTIFTPTNGWQTVNNVAAATPGAAVESDAALRIRQSISTSLPAQTVVDATVAAIANVSGVTKVRADENFTNTTNAIDVPAHAVCFTAVGGDPTAICQAILDQKTPGTNPVGNQAPITVYDAQGMPLAISYSIAVTAEIQVQVWVTPGVGWSADFVPLIQAAVAAAVNAYGIGAQILYSALFVPALLLGTPAEGTYAVTDIQIGINSGGVGHSAIQLQQGLEGAGPSQGAQNPVCNPASMGDVTVTVA